MGIRALVDRELAMRIKQAYWKERGVRGGKTVTQIAKDWGLGETTVYRIVHSQGAYRDLPEGAGELRPEEQRAAEELLQKLLGEAGKEQGEEEEELRGLSPEQQAKARAYLGKE